MLTLLAVFCLLGSLFFSLFLESSLPRAGAAPASAGKGMLVLFEDAHAPNPANRLLAAGLAVHGIALTVRPLADSSDRTDDTASTTLSGFNRFLGLASFSDPAAGLGPDIAALQAETGLAPSQIVYAARAAAVPALLSRLTRSASLPDADRLPWPGGLLLLTPAPVGTLGAAMAEALPAGLPVAVLAAADPSSARTAAELFLWLTGEDATLFPGFRGEQPLSPQTWLSASGSGRLALLPALSTLNSGWSPRLNQAIVQATAEILSDSLEAQAETMNRLPVSSTVLYSRTLIALYVLLLGAAAPLFLILSSRFSPAPAPVPVPNSRGHGLPAEGPAKPGAPAAVLPEPVPLTGRLIRLPAVLEAALYLPAAALALPVGYLFSRLADDARLTTGYRFFALLGIYGWFSLFAAWRRRRPPSGMPFTPDTAGAQSNAGGSHSGAAGLTSGAAGSPLRAAGSQLSALLIGGVLLADLVIWRHALSGHVLSQDPSLQTIWALVLSGLMLLPALLPFSYGFRHPFPKRAALAALLHALLPALFLLALHLAGQPDDWSGALWAVAAGLVPLLAARTVAKALAGFSGRARMPAPASALVPALAGWGVLLLLLPYPLL